MALVPTKDRHPTFVFPDLDGETKIRELILYISHRCQTDPRFGAVKLNKILVFADFTAYYKYGRPITGVQYMRQPNGPVPKRMLPILRDMEEKHEIAITLVGDGRFQQRRVVALRNANLELFTAKEIAIVDEVIAAFWKKTATAVSEFSHGIAWKLAGADGELIPYEAVLLSDEPPTTADAVRAEELAAELGW